MNTFLIAYIIVGVYYTMAEMKRPAVCLYFKDIHTGVFLIMGTATAFLWLPFVTYRLFKSTTPKPPTGRGPDDLTPA